jgi:hypothetical protein
MGEFFRHAFHYYALKHVININGRFMNPNRRILIQIFLRNLIEDTDPDISQIVKYVTRKREEKRNTKVNE